MSFIGIDVHGLKELRQKFEQLPDAVIGDGVELANEYLVNYEKTNQPSYRYVSLAEAYAGRPTLRKMQIWVFTHQPDIPYHRTQELSGGWKTLGSGKNQIVVNEAQGAGWVKDIATQSRMMFLRGWTVIQQDVIERLPEITRKFEAGVKKALHRLGLD